MLQLKETSDIFVRGLPKGVALHHVAPFIHRLDASAKMTIVAQEGARANGKVEAGKNLGLATSTEECHLGVNWRGTTTGVFHMDYSQHPLLMAEVDRIPNPYRKKPKGSAPPAYNTPPAPTHHGGGHPPPIATRLLKLKKIMHRFIDINMHFEKYMNLNSKFDS